MSRPAVLHLPESGIASWSEEVLRAAAGVPAVEIDVGAMGSLGLDELRAWRSLAERLGERGVPLRYRGDEAAVLLLRLAAGQRLAGDLQLELGRDEVTLFPGERMDFDRLDQDAASGIGRHLKAVPVVVDLERVGQVGSALINWLLQLRQHLGVERLELRNGSSRALAPLRQMGLDHVLRLD